MKEQYAILALFWFSATGAPPKGSHMKGEMLPFVPEFNGSLRIEARSDRLTSDAGVLALREIFDRLDMSSWLKLHLNDRRKQDAITYTQIELVRTAVLLLALGYRDHDDADALREEAAFRLAVSDRRGIEPLRKVNHPDGEAPARNPLEPEHLASQPTLSRLTAMLAEDGNRPALHEAIFETAARRMEAEGRDRSRLLMIDVDSLPVAVHGHQPEAEYNGHYREIIYHPLVASVAETGDILDVELRHGRAHTAEKAMDFILPLVERAEGRICREAGVRVDAGFPEERTLGPLEERGTFYVARVRNNAVLDRMAEPLLRRPPGRRPKEPRTWFHECKYQAGSWSSSRRVVLVVLERPGDLFLNHFFLITNWTPEQISPSSLLDLYRERGTAEGHQGELMSVLAPALSSTPRPKSIYAGKVPEREYPSVDAFAVNEVRFLLNAIAYNIMNAGRVLIARATGEGWGLGRFRERMLKVAARVIVHGQRATFAIGREVAPLWTMLWSAIGGLRWVETG